MKNVLILGGPGNISESTIRYFLEKNKVQEVFLSAKMAFFEEFF